MATDPSRARTEQTAELLQTLIRNACVNDGTVESGQEVRNCDVLQTFVEGAGLDVEVFEPRPGRRSMVARIDGTDPSAPSVCLCGHTDVVPVNPTGWAEDPFGGERIDDEIWGRGAVDMLNLTSSMAVAFRHLATEGPRPAGDVIFFACADEEAGSRWGAEWVAEHHWDAIRCDYVLTEFGGLPTDTPHGRKLTLATGEKGLGWRRITVRGTPGHGSMPFGADNALITAAEVVRRLADYRPQASLTDMWRTQIDNLFLDDETKAALLDPARVWDTVAALDEPALARHLHACSHTTFSPNVVAGGVKTNVIPDTVVIEVDIRSVPGQESGVDQHLRTALGDLYDRCDIEALHDDSATFSATDTPLWHALGDLMRAVHPGATLLPSLIVGATDARFFRERGAVAYGAGLFSERVSALDFMARFHGHDERVDLESLALTTQLWIDLLTTFGEA